jgi:hypothetical protein
MTTEAPQHLQALDLANHKRLTRAEVKRDVKKGSRSLADVIENYPPELDNMPVFDLVRSAHRWGKVRAGKFLRAQAISERRTFAQLSARQRAALVAELRAR